MRGSIAAANHLERRRLVDRAWQLYVQDGQEPSGIADEISVSWRRTREAYRIDPGLKRPTGILTPDALAERAARDEALRLARPLLRDLSTRLGLSEHVLAYFDGQGWMLSIDGEPDVLERVAEIGFRPGVNWSEESAGTNGPGTALAEGRPLEVFASEHFVAAWQPWSCVGAPVFAPGIAAPVGLVDITGPWEVHRRQALAVAKAVARAIEERLRAAVSVRDEVVRYAFRVAHHAQDAMVAVDARGSVIASNDAAARRGVLAMGALPEPAREALLRAFARPACGAEFRIEVPGAGPLIASPVTHEGAAIGAIVRGPASRAGPRAPARRAGSRVAARYDFELILGTSPALARATDLARVAARNALPVVLFGESGTGKELFAHAIHAASERRDGPFVAVNCGSIPAQLVESELFGYESGTFTGARREGNSGRFEDADGGTLFLDEVSELPGPAQTALLRVLQEKEVVRLGGSTPRPVDVRVVAATNKSLDDELAARRFRRDLYYRLNVLPIPVPPLRDRDGDLLLLASAFLAEAEAEVGRSGLSFGEDALAALRAHAWPGNVRELKNVILRAAANSPRPRIGAADLALDPVDADCAGRAAAPRSPAKPLRATVLASERDALVAALDASGWNCARAAASLGISRMTLYRRLKRCGISRDP